MQAILVFNWTREVRVEKILEFCLFGKTIVNWFDKNWKGFKSLWPHASTQVTKHVTMLVI